MDEIQKGLIATPGNTAEQLSWPIGALVRVVLHRSIQNP